MDRRVPPLGTAAAARITVVVELVHAVAASIIDGDPASAHHAVDAALRPGHGEGRPRAQRAQHAVAARREGRHVLDARERQPPEHVGGRHSEVAAAFALAPGHGVDHLGDVAWRRKMRHLRRSPHRPGVQGRLYLRLGRRLGWACRLVVDHLVPVRGGGLGRRRDRRRGRRCRRGGRRGRRGRRRVTRGHRRERTHRDQDPAIVHALATPAAAAAFRNCAARVVARVASSSSGTRRCRHAWMDDATVDGRRPSVPHR